MTEMIDAFQEIDGFLAHSIKTTLEPVTLLENIEAGSLRAWLRNALIAIDDESLKSGDYKKVIGAFLVRAKRIMVNWTEGRTDVTSKDELIELQQSVLDAAAETHALQIPMYAPVPTSEIARSIELISQAIEPLGEGDSIKYLSNSEPDAEFNRSFHVVPDSLTDLLVQESLVSEVLMILKVKKPDFLGDSRWEFRHGNSSVLARMEDPEWMSDFHAGGTPLLPGDALRATGRTTVRYGYDGEVVDTQYQVVRVLDVIRAIRPSQGGLFPNE